MEGSGSLGLNLTQGLVVALFLPEREHKDGKFAGHGNDSFFLGCCAAPGCQLESVAAQVAIWAEMPKDILCGLHYKSLRKSLRYIAGVGYY